MPVIVRPTVASTAAPHQSHNVIISEVGEDASADEVDFKQLNVSKLSRQNSTVSEQIAGSAASTTSSSQQRTSSGDTAVSAPSTLTKAKTEAKTGEVYV